MRCRRDLLLVLLLATACDGNFVPGSTITDLRVLGARLETGVGVLEVTAGARVDVALFLATPDGDPRGSTFALLCAEGITDPQRGVLCDEAPFDARRVDIAGPEANFDFRVPAEIDTVLLQGIACPADAPVTLRTLADAPADGLVPERSCAGGEKGRVYSLRIPVANDAGPHPLPRFAPDSFGVDGAPWAEGGGCGAPAERSIAPGALVEIALRIPAAETPSDTADDDGEDPLLVSHFTTAGELSRQFSLPTEETATVPLEWRAPASVAPEGLTVHFDFVLRDARLGADRARRQICVR